MRIFICDDDILCLENLHLRLSNYLDARGISHEIVSMSTPQLLLDDSPKKFDVLFLDVEMGAWNGIDVAQRVRQYDPQVPIVYVSGHIQYSIMGYGVDAFRYLLKTDLDTTFDECMAALLKQFNFKPEIIEIKAGALSIELKLEDILYIESEKRLLLFHVNHPEGTYRSYDTMASMEERLSAKGFLRIHKSYLVNIKYIHQIKNYQVVLEDGTVLQTTRHNFRELRQTYMLYRGKL